MQQALEVRQTLAGLRCRSNHGREEGQDIVEYALLAGLISIVAIALIVLVGPYLDNLYKDVINAINSA
jgi:pilus assembly protein Flp/PilA